MDTKLLHVQCVPVIMHPRNHAAYVERGIHIYTNVLDNFVLLCHFQSLIT